MIWKKNQAKSKWRISYIRYPVLHTIKTSIRYLQFCKGSECQFSQCANVHYTLPMLIKFVVIVELKVGLLKRKKMAVAHLYEYFCVICIQMKCWTVPHILDFRYDRIWFLRLLFVNTTRENENDMKYYGE